jgi:glycosyltransferase involved in cell wall biosynthesis
MKMLFLTNVPSPYRVDFFNELGKHCDLTVLFEKKTSAERDKSWKKYKFNTFQGVFLKGKSISVDTAFCPEVIQYVKDRSFDHIICTTFTDPTGMYAIQYMKRHHIPYYLECDGGFAKDGKGIKEKIKKLFISGAKGYFSTGPSCDAYYIQYGADMSKIYRYPFTSLYERDILKNPPTQYEKKQLRKKLEMPEDKIIVSVGRFSYQGGYGKGFDLLINSALKIPDTGIYIIGDEPTEEFLKMREKKNASNAHFIGFKNKSELSEYYRAADLFVLPTREDVWGLVINEAMAHALPIITTDKCGAGLTLVKEGKNGYIVPANNVECLVESMRKIIDNESLCRSCGTESLNIIRQYTIEKMVEHHTCI